MTASATQALITVVVPVRNRASLVGRTLRSIAAQELRPLHIIVVDNASTDDTPDVVERWAEINRHPGELDITILQEERQGAACARNRGLEAVDTPYVAFFDSDDEMVGNHLSRIADYLQTYPDTDLLYYDTAEISPEGWTSIRSHNHYDLAALHLLHGVLCTAAYVVRTSLIREAGGWNESLFTWDDLELGLRLLLQPGIKAKRLTGNPTVWIHPQEESLTGTSQSSRAEYHIKALAAIDRILDTTDAAEHLRLIVHARRIIMSALYRREGAPQAADAIVNPVESKQLPLKTAMKLGMIYTITRILGHGGSALTMHWFAEKAPKC